MTRLSCSLQSLISPSRMVPAVLVPVLMCFLFHSLTAAADSSGQNSDSVVQKPARTEQDVRECRVKISYFLHHQPRMASNQFAIWIEDMDGNYVATVFATRYTAQGGYRNRPLSLPRWRAVSSWDRVSSSRVDAVSGATPLSGKHKAVWDCKDARGEPVAPGKYIYRMEGNIFWENMVIWTGEIEIGDKPDQSRAEPEYIPERAHRKGIMLEEVKASFKPR